MSEKVVLDYTANEINSAIGRMTDLIDYQNSNNIVQLYDNTTPIYPKTKAEAVTFDTGFKLSNLIVSDNSDADLNIGDESGNVVVQFKSGQIKTKNFDSTDVNEDLHNADIKIKYLEECMNAVENGINDLNDVTSELQSTTSTLNKDVEDLKQDTYGCVTVESDTTNADLNIGDEDGNVLAQFQDGHLKTQNFDSRDVAEIKEEVENIQMSVTDDNSTADLNIGDDSGNIILQLSDGHIKTKNFDSRESEEAYNPYAKFKGKTIAMIGDSISTFRGWLPSDVSGYDGATYAVYYPQGTLTSVTQTWWYKVCKALGLDPATQFNNCAWSGSTVTGDSTSTTNAAAGCSTRRISDLTLRFNGNAPDIVIIYISCNDWGGNRAVGTWKISDAIPSEGSIYELRSAYALMLHKIHTSYPKARVFCCTNLDDTARDKTSGWPSNNSNGVSTYEWNENIKEVAHALGCDIINLHRCGINYSNIQQYYAVDSGLHPNAAGHTLMANRVVQELLLKY